MFGRVIVLIIMGIDPGIAIMGFGVISYEGNKLTPIDYGAVTTTADMVMSDRLKTIYCGVVELIEKYKPNAVAIEELFFNTNIKTAIMVGQARGAIIAAAANNDMQIFEYTPLQVKQAVTGYGRADKKQIQQMVKILLNLTTTPKPDDVADALAIAICHGNSSKFADQFKL